MKFPTAAAKDSARALAAMDTFYVHIGVALCVSVDQTWAVRLPSKDDQQVTVYALEGVLVA